MSRYTTTILFHVTLHITSLVPSYTLCFDSHLPEFKVDQKSLGVESMFATRVRHLFRMISLVRSSGFFQSLLVRSYKKSQRNQC
ncbi:hypothetical protein HanPI659440_Chr04g0161111 [Helianthus annuus]|nr:hypothetical protein HanPI659440_Chr04g0161111 [Helianthus annuus]